MIKALYLPLLATKYIPDCYKCHKTHFNPEMTAVDNMPEDIRKWMERLNKSDDLDKNTKTFSYFANWK